MSTPSKARPRRSSGDEGNGTASSATASSGAAASAGAAAPAGAERIAKRLARAGLCSRREAERWIEGGRVSVNGTVLASPACNVTAADTILVDGKPLPDAAPTRLWRYHKPAGLITSNRDPEGRATIYDKLPAAMGRVMSVGRLDYNSEGLLLLTNDGELARHLELPATGWSRRYRVRVHGRVDEAALARLKKGTEVEGVRYGPVTAELEKVQGSNAWLAMTLKEGKNREIRKLCAHLGLEVTRLIRVSYGPFRLDDLPRGEVAQIPDKQLRAQLGKGADRFGIRSVKEAGAASATAAKASGTKAAAVKASAAKPAEPGAGASRAHRRRPPPR